MAPELNKLHSKFQQKIQLNRANEKCDRHQQGAQECIERPKLLFTVCAVEKPEIAVYSGEMPLPEGEGDNYHNADKFHHVFYS